jgi:gamma-D-glutamyl-L-lysine dipeptidyl-peptidase
MPTTTISPSLTATFFLVRSPIAPLHAEPRASSPQVSQALAGWPLFRREERGEWLRVMGEDAYEGWVHRGFLTRPEPGDGYAGFARPPLVSLGCAVRGRDGVRRRLPLGALFDRDETVEDGQAVPLDEEAMRRVFPRQPAAVTRTAIEYFAGTSYQWGGVTPWGADCSGLVQTVFRLHGVPLPRDAWQQAEAGADAGRDAAAAGPADLLFFSDRDDRKVTHVAVALGASRVVHLALGRGGYAVDRLDDRDDPYAAKLAERFLFAKRVLK